MDRKRIALKEIYCEHGFTLVEIIIVIAVIGVLAAIAIPNILSWLPSMRLRAASRDLYSTMQQARFLAIKENSNTAIVFDIPNNQYFVRDDFGNDRIPGTGDAGENDNIYSNSMLVNETRETVVLTTYGSGITYGSGSAIADVGGGAWPSGFASYGLANGLPTLVFNASGLGNAGYVYLTNQNNDDVFAVGTLPSGAIRILRGTGANWQ